MRNAIFNPVAFLPWLFFALEGMITNAAGGLTLSQRLPAVGLGAVAAALSLYAGFPEEVYLYALMLVAWTVLRAAFLPRGAIVSLAADIALTGILALLLGAPLLAAFAAYLPEAELMQHGDGGFAADALGPESMLQYIAPYIYGRIFEISRPAIDGSWAEIGGYVGFAPLVLAIASLFVPRRRVIKLFLLAWIFVAVGVSHGLPFVQQAFNAIPLVANAVSHRYLNASWIFALLFLSALFIEAAPTLTLALLRLIMAIAVALGLGLTGLAVAEAWPLLRDLLGGSAHEAETVVFALLAVLLVAAALLAAAFALHPGRAATLMGGVMVLEALALFAYPSLSYPRGGMLDKGLVSFLRSRTGFQRVVSTSGAALGNNYGSYFGISSIHFDDLPVPKRTNDYITSHIDPFFGGTIFMPGENGVPPEVRRESIWLARLRLPTYAAAGVKFALSAPGYENVWLYNVGDEQAAEPYSMPPGSQIEVRLTQDARAEPLEVRGLSVGLAAFAPAGVWAATVCVDQSCVDGRAESSTNESAPIAIRLDRSVVIRPKGELTISLRRVDGLPALLRMVQLASQEGRPAISGTAGPVADGVAPDIRLRDEGVTLVYAGQAASVYELPDVRPYLSAHDCALEARSRDSLDLDCRWPSLLVRLELSMAGWSVTVNGKPAALDMLDDTFQSVAVPAGRSHVVFSFAPRGFWIAVTGAGLAGLCLLGIAAVAVIDRRRAI